MNPGPCITVPISSLSRIVLLILAITQGVAGIHRFVARRYITGLLMLVTAGGLGIWVIIDCILICLGNFYDGDDHPVYRWF